MDLNEKMSAWHAALEAAREEMQVVAQRRVLLNKQLEDVNARAQHLQLSIQVLSGLTQDTFWQHPELSSSVELEVQVHRPSVGSDESSSEKAASEAETKISEPLPRFKETGRAPTPDSAVYRAGLVLRERLRPTTTTEVCEIFKDRGWIDPDWKSPEASIRAALRRTPDWGWGRKLDRSRYVWPAVTDEPLQLHVGDSDDDDRDGGE